MDYAQAPRRLKTPIKTTSFLLATESLIKAVEARLTSGAAKKQAAVDQALKEGFILTAGIL